MFNFSDELCAVTTNHHYVPANVRSLDTDSLLVIQEDKRRGTAEHQFQTWNTCFKNAGLLIFKQSKKVE